MSGRQPAAKTAYVFPRVVRNFAAFVGHGDAARVTEEDVVRWKDKLLEQGLRGTTTVADVFCIGYTSLTPCTAAGTDEPDWRQAFLVR